MKHLLRFLGCLCVVVMVVSCKETEEQRIARLSYRLQIKVTMEKFIIGNDISINALNDYVFLDFFCP